MESSHACVGMFYFWGGVDPTFAIDGHRWDRSVQEGWAVGEGGVELGGVSMHLAAVKL